MSASTRIRKQIVYGIGFLVALAGLIWLGKIVLIPAAPASTPTPSPTEVFQPIRVEQADFIQHEPASPGENYTVDLVVRLTNPNPSAGVGELPLTVDLKDAQGRLIRQETITTYLLPGAPAYAAKINLAVPVPVADVSLQVPDKVNFTTIPASVSLPSFSTFLRERIVKTVGNKVIEEQKGIVTNTSNLDWQFVEVTGVAVGGSGRLLGVGQTFVGELKVGEQREFTLQWPATPGAVTQVIVLPTTNIYRQENIIRALGNPSLLR